LMAGEISTSHYPNDFFLFLSFVVNVFFPVEMPLLFLSQYPGRKRRMRR
jgi:hypothetical protein